MRILNTFFAGQRRTPSIPVKGANLGSGKPHSEDVDMSIYMVFNLSLRQDVIDPLFGRLYVFQYKASIILVKSGG
jgi:hypothetical protein